MRFRDPQSKPLWLERDAETYGRNLTQSEFDAELEDRPYRPLTLIPGGRSSSSRCHVNSPGVDTRLRDVSTVAPQHRTRPAALRTPPAPGGGPDFPEAA